MNEQAEAKTPWFEVGELAIRITTARVSAEMRLPGLDMAAAMADLEGLIATMCWEFWFPCWVAPYRTKYLMTHADHPMMLIELVEVEPHESAVVYRHDPVQLPRYEVQSFRFEAAV